MILCFFFIAFKWPFGVDKKQLAAMLRTWHMEKIIAYVFTSKPENTKTNVNIHDITKPVTEQARKPITRCCKVRLGHNCSFDSGREKMLSLSLGSDMPS